MTIYGVDGAEWGATNQQTINYLSTHNVKAMRMAMYINEWNSDLVHWQTGDHIQQKYAQISAWCHAKGMKLIISAFGTEWDPPEGWEPMKQAAIDNVNGAGDTWINTYADIIRVINPDAICVMNEPPSDCPYAHYKDFCIKAITAWRAISPNITIVAHSIPFWDFRAVTSDPLPFNNIKYALHYYYDYDNTDPRTWSYVDQPQIDYWDGNLAEAKVGLFDYLDRLIGVQGAIDAGLQIWVQEAGTNYLNPNYLQFYKDFIDYTVARNLEMGMLHVYRIRSETPNGILETVNPDKFNDLGNVIEVAPPGQPLKFAGKTWTLQSGNWSLE